MADTQRVFFALWPDYATRLNMQRVFKQSPQSRQEGRKFLLQNLHLTLHYIGQVGQTKLDCLHRAAKTLHGESFQLSLDHFGAFTRARVFWSGPSIVPTALKQLHTGLGEALAGCDYRVEARTFTPHVTLMRKVRCEQSSLIQHEPVIWKVDQFALVESVSVTGGVEYRPLAFYGLNVS